MTEKLVLLAISSIGSAALWWAAVIFAEYRCAKAKADGVEDWEDIFWARVLSRLDAKRLERLR